MFAGQCRLIELGFRQGGPAGFGLRRVLLDQSGVIKTELSRGEHKSLQTDRVILVLGADAEVATVNQIFQWLIEEDLAITAIASRLNGLSVLTDLDRPWTYSTVRQVLSNEKYIGNNVYNRHSFKLKKKHVDGICPEAIALLQDKQFTPDMTRVLRNMKAARQVEAVELMIASNTITVAHAEALLKATPHEQRTDLQGLERDRKTPPIEQLVKLEMNQIHEHFKDAEMNYGSDLLNLVLARGYLTKLLANAAIRSFIERQEPEILEHFELVINTVSMEEAIEQKQTA